MLLTVEKIWPSTLKNSPSLKDQKKALKLGLEMQSDFEFHFLKVACAFRRTCEKVIGAKPLMSFKAFLNVYH